MTLSVSGSAWKESGKISFSVSCWRSRWNGGWQVRNVSVLIINIIFKLWSGCWKSTETSASSFLCKWLWVVKTKKNERKKKKVGVFWKVVFFFLSSFINTNQYFRTCKIFFKYSIYVLKSFIYISTVVSVSFEIESDENTVFPMTAC